MTVIHTAKNKIRRNSAFTLAEALVAILIMLMVTVIVATGIPAASRAYRNVVDTSNAEVALSTAMNTLRNELGLANDAVISDDKKSITYYNCVYNTISKLTVEDDSEEGILYERFAGSVDPDEHFGIDIPPEITSEPERLISKEASNGDMYVKYDRIINDGKVVIFINLAVYKEGNDKPLVNRPTYSVRVISG